MTGRRPGWVARGIALAAVFVAAMSLMFGAFMWSDMKDYRDRNTHIEQCADVAETIAGFRRCVDG